MSDAIGMVETKGMVPLVQATDAMLKTANVKYPDQKWQAKHRLIAIEPKK